MVNHRMHQMVTTAHSLIFAMRLETELNAPIDSFIDSFRERPTTTHSHFFNGLFFFRKKRLLYTLAFTMAMINDNAGITISKPTAFENAFFFWYGRFPVVRF